MISEAHFHTVGNYEYLVAIKIYTKLVNVETRQCPWSSS